ncbi:MAG: selenium-dependent xanthine dehydrogenase [Sarcina sp.]
MFEFILNGEKVVAEENEKLLHFLRDKKGIVSVKNGCDEGACGACTLLIDDVAMKACVQTLERINGKTITTIEGFTDREKEVFAYAFTEAGAVQCGFCIPGMVMAAKGLFNKTLEPTADEVKKALRGNICRCTGYVKIEEAIMLAAEIFRENKEVPKRTCKGLIGESTHKVDAIGKTLGTAPYADDLYFDGMLYGGALRPEHARILVKKIDISKALEIDGVEAVLTAKDIPGERYIGHLKQDWPAMIAEGEETRYVGDTLALVAARDKKTLKEALKAIEVDYEKLTPVTEIEDALKDDSPKVHATGNLLVHEKLRRGDAEAAIKNSKYVYEDDFIVPPTEHAFMEPEAAVAKYEDGVLEVYTGGQGIYDEVHEITKLLGLTDKEVRIKSMYVGGGFGGKEDMSVQHHAALLTYVTKKPVKVVLSRQESLNVHPKRHLMKMHFIVGCDEKGILQGMRAEIFSDTGAYASLGGPVLQRACTHAGGPYNFQNISIDGKAVYTNNPPAGAFRGFGVTQSAFAMEACVNKLAEMVGISGWEMRYRNAIRPGDVLPNGQIADEGTAFVETLEAVKEEYENNKIVGIASAFKNAGIGVGIPDTGRCNLAIIDGKVHLRTSAADIGQGIMTIASQVVSEVTGLNPELIEVERPDSFLTPDSGTTTASRQTVFTGEATKVAALQLKEALKGKELSDLNGEIFKGEYCGITDPMGSDKENPVSHIAYGFATQVVVLDEQGKLVKVIAAHDVGKAINPKGVEGQIEGGVTMGLGYALTEDFPTNEGVPAVKYGTLGLLRSISVPEIVPIIIEKNHSELSFGAKGVGEIVCVPTAPAVQNAYYNFDKVFRTKLPLGETAYRKKK